MLICIHINREDGEINMSKTITLAQTTKEKILFKIQFFCLMSGCGRDEEAKQALKDAITLIEDADIK